MAIVGFNYTKMTAEKKSAVNGKINISNNVSVKKVESINMSLGSKEQKGLKFTFDFTSKYDPEVGVISLTGEVLAIETEEKSKEILDEWKKDKKISQEVMSVLLNNILQKCNIQALIMSKDINLPPPIPMPKVKQQ